MEHGLDTIVRNVNVVDLIISRYMELNNDFIVINKETFLVAAIFIGRDHAIAFASRLNEGLGVSPADPTYAVYQLKDVVTEN